MAYPRSFLGLLLTGFTLVTIPLVGALAYSAWNTERLAEQSRNAVFNASQAARASRSLVNRISSIERLAQQIAVLDDAGLVADYAQVHAGFKQVSDELSQLPLDEQQFAALQKTVAQEQALYDLLGARPLSEEGARQVTRVAGELAEHAHEVLALSHLVADREVLRLRSNAETVQRQLILLVLFSTAIALGIALALTRYISRPIAELDGSIRQLGGADFSRPIRVRGPEDLQTLGERLDWLRRRLSELEVQKNRFLRHLSHELKTPLTALREGAELLGDEVAGPLSPQQRQVVSIMRDNSIKLQRLIEDLLDYQRALHSAASLLSGSVALDALVREVARSHDLAVRAKGQHLALDLGRVSLDADAEKLRSIVDNLIGNAVKFTPAGGTISVVVRAIGDEAIIDVIDSGPGVPPEESESVFESFFRGRTKASGRVEGTGLGLAIAREYTEAHGGRISVIAGKGEGGHFRVRLPRNGQRALAVAA
ncbi:MAG TPA: HAMP domain-containing sensor histidine kinase [Burkholderiales bacterium]|jgi:two-component system sensor histidine kinase GlrK|nr:HAMP domain-containing sensor histidine kinase [Burkholderiales bacterium]